MVDPHTHGSPQLSIVIPAHNEAGRILPYLRQIIDYCEGQRRSYELLVVDDGSTDGTSLVVGRLAQVHSTVQLLRLPTCHGKGAAVRYGMQSAVGCLQLFADADGATPIQELARLEKALAGGADMAIGSRALAARLPNFVVHARVYRSVLGSLFNAAVRQGGIKDIADTQCGFKLFRRMCRARTLRLCLNRWIRLRSRIAVSGPAARIPHCGGPGELVRPAGLESPRPARRLRHAARVGRDQTQRPAGPLPSPFLLSRIDARRPVQNARIVAFIR